jgi:hypothetical protein
MLFGMSPGPNSQVNNAPEVYFALQDRVWVNTACTVPARDGECDRIT